MKKNTYIDELIPADKDAESIIDLDEALHKLKEFDSRMAEIVEYRFFGGMTIEETAEFMKISESTVKRDWEKARGLLYKVLQKQEL